MFGRFLGSERGNLTVIMATALVPLTVAVAGGVDAVSMTMKISQLQDSLDAAALEIGTKYYSGMTDEDLQATGRVVFMANMLGANSQPLDFQYESNSFTASADEAAGEDYISVRSSILHDSMIGWSWEWRATRESVVRVWPGMPACMLALDKHAAAAVNIQGSTEVDMAGCVIAANSDSQTSVSRGGSAKVSAECIITTGKTSGLVSNSNTDLECGSPIENQYRSRDPLARVNPPAATGCRNAPSGRKITLSPGTYCNEVLSGEVTLEPGVYVLRGGGVKLGGNGYLVGQGVTIFLLDGAEFVTNANQVVQLSPPTSGDYAGITLFQAAGNTGTVTINGGAGSEVTGFIYAPDAHVFYAGNSSMSGEGNCLRIVADTIEMTGTSSVKSDCTAELGGRELRAGRHISLFK